MTNPDNRPPPKRTVPADPEETADRASAPEPALHVAVVGASGFLGGAVLDVLLARGVTCTAIARRPPAPTGPSMTGVAADLGDPAALTAALAGVDVIVHAASYTGSDEAQYEQINVLGTRNLLAAAAAQGIDRIFYLSTIGVYGPGPHRNVGEGELEPNPVTALSASRLAAENLVRDHGGLVLRPGFVHGPGDRWFLPGLARIVSTLGVWIDNGVAGQSVISRRDVGRLTTALAVRPLPDAMRGGMLHVADRTPTSVHDLVHVAAAQGLLTPPTASVSYEQALHVGLERGLSARHIDLIGHDHHYASTRIWAHTELATDP
ncbi:NAD-dependent epimerase/dehydratase family protein [Rhodococcus sp. SJ-3]|uniref:NAD-dependent epimerase/dehydratase family protein n=1 Tax=Rhodococcus sp. SJ-3 TaxID=3454628 RepID=UPI003F796BD9